MQGTGELWECKLTTTGHHVTSTERLLTGKPTIYCKTLIIHTCYILPGFLKCRPDIYSERKINTLTASLMLITWNLFTNT